MLHRCRKKGATELVAVEFDGSMNGVPRGVEIDGAIGPPGKRRQALRGERHRDTASERQKRGHVPVF
jgi:hypothetical protein